MPMLLLKNVITVVDINTEHIVTCYLFVCAAGLVQPVEDRPGDGQDDDAQQRVCVPAAGHGEKEGDYIYI